MPPVEIRATTSQSPLSEILLPAIAELEQPLRRILHQAKPKIEAQKYNLIVGDDMSGRVPTIILWKIIENVYRENGSGSLPVLFICPRPLPKSVYSYKNIDLQYMETQLQQRTKTFGLPSPLQALLVTELVAHGSSLKAFRELFRIHKIQYDVAALWIWEEREMNKILPRRSDLFWGRFVPNGYMPEIHRNTFINGVEINSPYKKEVVMEQIIRSSTVEARHQASILAQKLTKELFGVL